MVQRYAQGDARRRHAAAADLDARPIGLPRGLVAFGHGDRRYLCEPTADGRYLLDSI
jgi:hypothetical protein